MCKACSKKTFWSRFRTDLSNLDCVKAGTDYGTYSTAQPEAAAKNMMFASVDSQQTCCEHAMNMFRDRAVLPRNDPKIVRIQDQHKDIPCRRMLVQPIPCHRMLVRPSWDGSLCHKHFFSNSQVGSRWPITLTSKV